MPNISKLSLAALRDQINAGTREVTFKTDDGALTQMIYIPKFRIPAGIWDNGQFPPQDLLLGGFFVDKYQCSHKNATSASRGIGANPTITAGSTTDVAVSLPGKVPWTEITLDNAKKACENRKINGVSCRLITMKEWATLAFLIKLLGHDIRGNNYFGLDIRDPDSFEYYGVPDVSIGGTPGSSGYPYYGHQFARVLTGTGPISWSHNGMANGVFDLVGNVWEFIDFTIDTGIYTAKKTAVIQDADGITATDTAIVIANVQNPELWPANGLVLIKADGTNTDEYVRYSNFVDNGNGTYTLTGCQRGQEGTTAGPHGNGAQVIQMTDYCLIPGGYSAVIADSGLNNTTNPATFTYSKLVLGPGKTGPAVGDVLQVENEQTTVTAVNGNQLTVNRGANGSTIAAHAQGVKFACISPQMSNNDAASTDATWVAWQFGLFLTMRTEPELAALALPASVNASAGNEEWKDGFWARWKGQRVALRGGSWDSGAPARAAVALYLSNPVGYWSGSLGFRAALSL